MIDGLAALRAGVDHQSIALMQPFAFGNLRGGGDQAAHQIDIAGLHLVDRRQVSRGNDENVCRCLGLNVAKGYYARAAIDNFGRGFARYDLTEDAVRHG